MGIKDADPDVVAELLEYVYTAEAPCMKEPEAPKRPLGAYHAFFQEQKPLLSGRARDWQQQCVQLWLALTPEERSARGLRSQEQMQEYKEAMARYAAVSDSRVDHLLSVLALADMYQIPELVRVCCSNILDT